MDSITISDIEIEIVPQRRRLKYSTTRVMWRSFELFWGQWNFSYGSWSAASGVSSLYQERGDFLTSGPLPTTLYLIDPLWNNIHPPTGHSQIICIWSSETLADLQNTLLWDT